MTGKSFIDPTDKTLRCMHCGKEFLFTVNEQKYYQDHGFVTPKRCKVCRKRKNVASIEDDKNKFSGLGKMNPKLSKGNFRGGVDVTDISGKKWHPQARKSSGIWYNSYK